jgi:predicted enzyme related to lactoylglutathione lyase
MTMNSPAYELNSLEDTVRDRMQRVWPIIAVADVPRSVQWYLTLLGGAHSHPGAIVFDQILSDDREVLLCLHHWGPSGPTGDHHWATLSNPAKGNNSNGLLLWFVVDDFDATWQRAQTLDARVEELPSTNNGTGMRAFVILDPDRYHVAINERRTS